MLELKDALLEVDGKQLFQRLSLMARDGQLTCITGAHGIGKTLLARVIVGLHPLDGGYVSIDGELLTPLSAPVFRKMTVYLPQPVEPATVDFEPDTSDLECVWGTTIQTKTHPQPLPLGRGVYSAGGNYSPPYREGPGEGLEGLLIADDPDISQLEYLKSQAQQGRTVIVMSQRQEYLTAADQLITLEAL